MIIIEKGCPICGDDVKGDRINKFYCEKCNILYDKRQVIIHKKTDKKKPEIKNVKKGKIVKTSIFKEKGWLYFVDKHGDISRVRMASNKKGKSGNEKVEKVGLKKEKGYLYYIDKDGDISRSPMKRGGK